MKHSFSFEANSANSNGENGAQNRAPKQRASKNGAAQIQLNGPAPERDCTPEPLCGPGTLHLRIGLAHIQQKLLGFLVRSGWTWAQQDGTLSIRVPGEDLTSLALPLTEVLSSGEQAHVRAIFQPDGRSLKLSDYFEIDTLHAFIAHTLSGWLVETMQSSRLTTVFQPIVRCCASGDEPIFAHECLLRSVEGDQIISPNRILDVARGAGLLFQLDLAARCTAIREAARHNIESKIFINFTPTAIYDPIHGLRNTVKTVDEMGLKREQIVFEVIESELIQDVSHLRDVLQSYRDCGFGIALDDLGSGYSSLNLLIQLRPDYVKLDRELTSGVHCDRYKALIAQKLLETARALELKTIAEGVEHAEEFEWLLDHDADYAQGFYFARPASPPPAIREYKAAL